MALSLSNVCLHRTNFGLKCVKNKILKLTCSKNSVRYLRGNRLGRNLNKEEIKYRNLIKTLREESNKPVIYNGGNIPVGEVASPPTNITTNSGEKIDTAGKIDTAEDLAKKLELRITPLKDVTYTRQLEKKYNNTLGFLRVFGQKLRSLKVPIALGDDHLPCPVDLTVPSPMIESYRNQDQFSIGTGFDQNPRTVGYFVKNNVGDSNICLNPDQIAIIKECHKEFLKDFQNYIRESPLNVSVQLDDGGFYRSIQVRSNFADEIMGVIMVNPQNLTEEELKIEEEKLKNYFCVEKPYTLKSLYLYTSSNTKSGVKRDDMKLLYGQAYISELFRKMEIRIYPKTYFLSNTKGLEAAYETLLRLCRVRENTTILDIFCGTGALSLTMSPHVSRCIGIDTSLYAVENSRENAAINNRKHNVKFTYGNVEYLINDILSKEYFEDLVVVINPTRAELNKTAIKCLRACKHLKKIVYITTKPKAVSENFERLCKPCGAESYLGKYFVPILAVPVDIYPQTNNFAFIIVFQRI